MEYKVSEILNIISGGTPRRNNSEYWNGDIPWLTVKDFNNDNRLVHDTQEKITMKGLENSSATLVSKGTIVISARGTVGELCQVAKSMTFNQSCFGLEAKTKYTTNEYIYYWFKYKINYVKSNTHGSVFDTINRKTFENLYINLPNIRYQNKVVNILRCLDNKIENNKQIIKNLEELSQTLFKRWFVDFEFPDENGNPYKSSGGDMVESELGVIPKDWSIQTLNDISESYNTKRKPLSKLEREKVASIYPYYGATKIIDYVDDYLFDGKFILVGEDGTVQTEEGHPFVQYVWGQFWVSNHAHILKGKNLSDEVLMLILNNIDIQPYITGAVQPKISKKNLNSIKIVVGSKLIYGKFDQYINTYYKKIREVHDENKYLTQLRDTLLPKLMSGEIEIPDDIEVNEDELSI